MRASDPGENPHGESVAEQIAALIEDIEDHLGERSDVDEGAEASCPRFASGSPPSSPHSPGASVRTGGHERAGPRR